MNMDNNQKENKVIFDCLYYEKEDDFLITIQSLNDEQKKDLIRRIFNYSYKQGIYNLSEAEFISVFLRYL